MSSHRTLNTNAKANSWFNVLICLMFVLSFGLVKCQFVNQPPRFMPGTGDMARFSLSENTPIDSPVYQLRGKSKWEVEFCQSISTQNIFLRIIFGLRVDVRNPDKQFFFLFFHSMQFTCLFVCLYVRARM